MRETFALCIHLIVVIARLCRPGGIKALLAENLMLRQQFLVISRGNRRTPRLRTADRFFLALIASFIRIKRLQKIASVIKPATILRFHQALVKRKYRTLYSANFKRKPGRKPRDQQLIELVIEMKKHNPSMGYGRIAMQIHDAFGVEISRFAVGRIFRKYTDKWPSGGGPSRLTFIGHTKDSLWSVDLFRCESMTLKSLWVMVVIDQFTRRVIGFAIHAGDCDGVAYCTMFNNIIGSQPLPRYLSSDNDPIFLFHRWQANLRVMEIEEIKTVPGVPTSHPFVERVILSCRKECLDHQLFWHATDLQRKLNQFKDYYNVTRIHSPLAGNTPNCQASNDNTYETTAMSIKHYRWKSHCGGL